MIKPRRNQILVRPIPQTEVRTPSGLIVPNLYQSNNMIGEVIAIGPGNRRDNGSHAPIDVTLGQLVMYSIHSGNKVKVGSEELVLLGEEQLLADVEEDD